MSGVDEAPGSNGPPDEDAARAAMLERLERGVFTLLGARGGEQLANGVVYGARRAVIDAGEVLAILSSPQLLAEALDVGARRQPGAVNPLTGLVPGPGPTEPDAGLDDRLD